MTNKKPTIVFAPGCFDDFEGSQDELNEMISDITKMFESGEFINKMERVDGEEIDEEELEEIREQFNKEAIRQGVEVVFGTVEDMPEDLKEQLSNIRTLH